MIEAIEVVRAKTESVTLEAFEADRDRRWLVERAVEMLRHDYARVAPEVVWAVAREHLPELEQVCREELARDQQVDLTGGSTHP